MQPNALQLKVPGLENNYFTYTMWKISFRLLFLFLLQYFTSLLYDVMFICLRSFTCRLSEE